MNVYIPTCDKNMFIIKYFQYFFNKYWDKSVNVKILGFQEPDFALSDNFEFISLSPQQEGGAQQWTTYLKNFFMNIDDEFFIFGLDDFMVARPVNFKSLEVCKKEILNNSKVGRVDLQCGLQYGRKKGSVFPYKSIDGLKFLKLKQHSDGDWQNNSTYRVSAAFSIWRKEWFMKTLKEGWTPWEWELIGSRQTEQDGYEVLGVIDHHPVKKVEVLSNRWAGVINTRALRDSDIKNIKNLVNKKDRVKKFVKLEDDDLVGYTQILGDKWESVIYGK